MKATRKTAAVSVCALISLWILAPCLSMAGAQELPPAVYSAKEIRGTVVDEQSGQPLEGVVIVAQWVLFVATPAHGGSGPRLHIFETVTDNHGNFLIPGWGPKPNPRYPFTSLDYKDPQLSFFKPGYRPLTVQNRWERNDSVRISEWDGKTIKIAKFKGTDEQLARELHILQTTLAWGDERLMEWRQVPKMILAILQEGQRLPRKLLLRGPESLGTTVEEIRRFVEGKK